MDRRRQAADEGAAALHAFRHGGTEGVCEVCRAESAIMLEAVSPVLKAAALEEAASDTETDVPGRVRGWLRHRAIRTEQGWLV